ncbi:MAG: hypothetical protein IT481_08495 [Gammaproteobacteria bacterium]|nr:hypothetical protein [Gammaproteobacteria bacterium]
MLMSRLRERAGEWARLCALAIALSSPPALLVLGLTAASIALAQTQLGGFRTSQVAVDTTAGGTKIASERVGRRYVTVVNHGTTVVYVGISGLTTSTGARLAGVDGAAMTIATEKDVYAIVGSGSQTVSVIESW